MKPEFAGIIAVLAIAYLLIVLPSGINSLVTGDPGSVIITDGTYVGSVSTQTRAYLKTFGIAIYKSRIDMPGNQKSAEIPLPRIGESEAIAGELRRIAGQS